MTPLQLMEAMGIKKPVATREEYVDQWVAVKDMVKALSEIEMDMRKTLFAATFTQPKEGANTFVLSDGRKLKAQHKINRSIDAAAVAPTREAYALLNDRPVEFDALLKVEYSLVTSAFRKVEPAPGEEPSAAYMVISQMIVAKPGAPALEL
jgi:hypothetical protein